MAYVELHAHSAFSFLDGASHPEELAIAAQRLGYDAIALTDHNSVSGSMELAQAVKGLSLRAIHGAEVDVVDGAAGPPRHLTLLVESEAGWRNLCRLLTRAYAHTRNRPDRPARSMSAPFVSLDAVLEHAEGLVCLSGCARSGVRDEPTMRRLLEAFGPEDLRVELQRPFARHDRALNRGLAALARRLGLRTVATGNVHAHSRERAPLQDAFVAIREHTTLDASEPLRRGNFAHVLASPGAMAARFEDHPEAVRETLALADRLRFDLTSDLGYRYPGSEDAQANRKLSELCQAQFDHRYPPGSSHRTPALARLEEELRVIAGLGLAGFFILHRDLLELAREVAHEVRGPDTARALLPPGRGRGSSVSSIVCYLTGLSHIDPIANELFLGRFLNEELTALPDIDLDFPRDIREVLIPRVHERYGREHSALVAAFPTYRSRGAVRELGKALGLPPGEIERVARVAEPWSAAVDDDVHMALAAAAGAPTLDAAQRIDNADLERAVGEAGRGDRLGGRWAWLTRLAQQAYGLPRHLSQHPGGMIVSTRPLIDCVPLVPAAMEGRQMCQWDKDSCADAGFLKIDLLGLGMLSAVERCVEEVWATRRTRIDLSRIPFDDPETYEAIQTADTMGVFQIESRAQMASLLRTRPETLDELTIQVAIVRPGPIVGGAVNPYIERKQRLRVDPGFQVPYEHPSLEPVLKDTLGTIIFQDQVLEVAMAFAGLSAGEAEGLRRAMSRKRSEAAIEAYHERFVEGAVRTHGVDREAAERVFSMVAGFSGFGFPKAHGAAFGLLAYQSTWLRVHYKPEFTCALLNEQPMGFYPSDTLIHEAQRTGIEIRTPDVNASKLLCSVEGEGRPEAIRIGLGYLVGAREEEMRTIVAERDAHGPFRSLGDLASRAGASRASLSVLAWSGACDSLCRRPNAAGGVLGGDPCYRTVSPPASLPATPGHPAASAELRRQVLWELGVAAPAQRSAAGDQLALPLELPAAPALRALEPWERMVADYATTGLTAGPHPVALMRPELAGAGAVSSRDFATLRHGQRVRVAGLTVARQRPATANGIVFMLLEDEFGTLNLVVPAEVYQRYRLVVRGEPLVLAAGRLEKHPAGGGAVNVLVEEISRLEGGARELASIVDLPTPTPAAEAGGAGAGDFRAVAPPVMSFAQGRRR